MGQILVRLVKLTLIMVILFATGWKTHDFLYQRRHPDLAQLKGIMAERLGPIDAEHRDLVEQAILKDRYGALLAVSSADPNKDRYQALTDWMNGGLTDEMCV